ncbi:MAG: YceH family protein [Planctomycetota bacterium]
MLDRTEQRIVGVLIEKEATVPDTYPMTENGLVAGCNQKNNRDPVMELQSFEVAGALRSLMEKGWVARVDGGGRVTKWRHKVVEHLGVRPDELKVLCELLVRGPQAPGALKPRLARLGYSAEPAAIEDVLRRMASRPQPLVEQLPRQPRERDARWGLLIGARVDAPAGGDDGDGGDEWDTGRAATAAPVASAAQVGGDELALRVTALERQVAELQALVARLQTSVAGAQGG